MSGARGSGECKCTLEHSVLTTHRLRCRFSAQPGGFGFRHTPFDVFQRAVSHVLRLSKNGPRRMVCLLALVPNTYPSSSFLLNHGFRRRLIQHGAYPGRHLVTNNTTSTSNVPNSEPSSAVSKAATTISLLRLPQPSQLTP